MGRVDFGSKPLSTPQPVWILATYDENGNADAMNAVNVLGEIVGDAFSAGNKLK